MFLPVNGQRRGEQVIVCAAEVARAYCDMAKQSQIQVSSRTGTSLLTGEDLEINYVACDMGLGMAIFPELKLTHLIPKERIAESYLLRIYEGTLASEFVLAYKWRGVLPRNPFTILGLLDFIANTLTRGGLQRRMYFAQKRAVLKALKIIKVCSTKCLAMQMLSSHVKKLICQISNPAHR